jgi:hypothetical protein
MNRGAVEIGTDVDSSFKGISSLASFWGEREHGHQREKTKISDGKGGQAEEVHVS